MTTFTSSHLATLMPASNGFGLLSFASATRAKSSPTFEHHAVRRAAPQQTPAQSMVGPATRPAKGPSHVGS
ncbi:MAG: hypothetical protein JXR13_07015 [Thalassovita sp.]